MIYWFTLLIGIDLRWQKRYQTSQHHHIQMNTENWSLEKTARLCIIVFVTKKLSRNWWKLTDKYKKCEWQCPRTYPNISNREFFSHTFPHYNAKWNYPMDSTNLIEIAVSASEHFVITKKTPHISFRKQQQILIIEILVG